jgi:hypothetical protein
VVQGRTVRLPAASGVLHFQPQDIEKVKRSTLYPPPAASLAEVDFPPLNIVPEAKLGMPRTNAASFQ